MSLLLCRHFYTGPEQEIGSDDLYNLEKKIPHFKVKEDRYLVILSANFEFMCFIIYPTHLCKHYTNM